MQYGSPSSLATLITTYRQVLVPATRNLLRVGGPYLVTSREENGDIIGDWFV
jgi:hypothetical protein